MNKKDLIKIAVIAIIALFLFETVAIGFLNGQNSDSSEQKTGYVDCVISLNSYDKYIVLNNKLEEDIAEKIRKIEGVDSVSSFSGKTIIESSDTYSTYKSLKAMDENMKGSSNAYFSIEYCAVEGAEKNYKDTIALNIEPLLRENVLIKAGAPVLYKGKDILATGQISLNVEEKTLKEKAQITSLQETYYSYIIPWEKRMLAKGLGIEINNVVYVSKQVGLDALPEFVKSEGNGYIIVADGFADKEAIIAIYGNDAVFKDIEYKSNEELNLSYASKSQKYLYVAKLLSNSEEISYGSLEPLETGSMVEINAKGVYSGSYLLYLTK